MNDLPEMEGPPVLRQTSAKECADMHAWYCESTKQPIRFGYTEKSLWFQALSRFDPESIFRALTHVVLNLKKGGHIGMLSLSNFLKLDTMEQRLLALSAVKKITAPKRPSFLTKEVKAGDGTRFLADVRNEECEPVPMAEATTEALSAFVQDLKNGGKKLTTENAEEHRA